MEWWPPPKYAEGSRSLREVPRHIQFNLLLILPPLPQLCERALSYVPCVITICIVIWSLWHYPVSTLILAALLKVPSHQCLCMCVDYFHFFQGLGFLDRAGKSVVQACVTHVHIESSLLPHGMSIMPVLRRITSAWRTHITVSRL